MSIKTLILKKIAENFKKMAKYAVEYAENLLGSGTGTVKKELAIDYLLSKLPAWLKPLVPFLKQQVLKIADNLIEKAVDKLHEIQAQQKHTA